MNQIIGINDWYLFPQVARIIVFQRIIGPVLLGITPDEAAVAGAVPDAELCLRELNRLLGNQPFMAGDQLSLADLMVAPQIYYLAATPEGRMILKARRPAWADECARQHEGNAAAGSFARSRLNTSRKEPNA